MPESLDVELNEIDTLLMQELSVDGRQHVSDLARKFGVSRAYVARRLQRLLNRQITKINAYTDPRALGYRIHVFIGLRVSLDHLYDVAHQLSALPAVQVVLITAGPYDIVVTAVIRELDDLSKFMNRELERIQGICSTEVTFITELKKLSYAYAGYPPVDPAEGAPVANTASHAVVDSEAMEIDDLDLAILKEMEIDGRQSISSVAAKLRASRPVIRARLQRLIDHQITRIVAFTHPALLGYQMQATIGIKAGPYKMGAVMERLIELPETFWVARVAGRYDAIIWVMFRRPSELSGFICRQLGPIPGITSTEAMIGLDTTKIGFADLASTCLATQARQQMTCSGESSVA